MPDKQNENKFMAMLERRGIVRKAGSEDEDMEEAEPGGKQAQPEADLRSLFNTPVNDTSKVIPVSRQPVPGMSTPIMPSERQQQIKAPGAQPAPAEERFEPARQKQTGDHIAQSILTETPTERPRQEQQKPVETQRPQSFFSSDETIRDASFKAERPVVAPSIHSTYAAPAVSQPAPVPPPASPPPPATVAFSTTPVSMHVAPAAPTAYERPQELPLEDNYTDRYLDINELYEVLSLRSRRTDTIYLVEEYLKTLPDSLPDESRRDIVSKIVAASGFDYDLLTGDGVLRVKMLKEYAEKFAKYTDEYIAARNAELAELEQRSVRIRKMIESRRDLHKKQFFAIEAEAQRLKEILIFISG